MSLTRRLPTMLLGLFIFSPFWFVAVLSPVCPVLARQRLCSRGTARLSSYSVWDGLRLRTFVTGHESHRPVSLFAGGEILTGTDSFYDTGCTRSSPTAVAVVTVEARTG